MPSFETGNGTCSALSPQEREKRRAESAARFEAAKQRQERHTRTYAMLSRLRGATLESLLAIYGPAPAVDYWHRALLTAQAQERIEQTLAACAEDDPIRPALVAILQAQEQNA